MKLHCKLLIAKNKSSKRIHHGEPPNFALKTSHLTTTLVAKLLKTWFESTQG